MSKPPEIMTLTKMPVDAKTKETYDKWRSVRNDRHWQLFQKMVLFCQKGGFDPITAPMKWEDEG